MKAKKSKIQAVAVLVEKILCKDSSLLRITVICLPDSERGGQFQNCSLHFHC